VPFTNQENLPEDEPRALLRRSLAGISFEVRCATHGLKMFDYPGYRDFNGPTNLFPSMPAPIEIMCRVASSGNLANRLPEGFLDGGSWGYYADGDDAVFFAPQPHSGLSVHWLARIPRAETRSISVDCSEALLADDHGEPILADPFRYPLDQIVLVRLLADRGLLLHAAGAVRQGRSLIFPGVSGAGKTTISRILEREDFTLLSDDRIVVRREAGGFSAWGTPWPGEGGYARNEHAPLAGVCFLKKGSAHGLRRFAPQEALPHMLRVASVPWYDPDAVEGPLECIDALLKGVPVYELTFRPEAGAASSIAQLMEVAR